MSTNDKDIPRYQNKETHITLRKSHGNTGVTGGEHIDPSKTIIYIYPLQDMKCGLWGKRKEEKRIVARVISLDELAQLVFTLFVSSMFASMDPMDQ